MPRLAPVRPGEQQARPERVEIWSPVQCWENKNYKQSEGAVSAEGGRPGSQEAGGLGQATAHVRRKGPHSSFLSVEPSISS